METKITIGYDYTHKHNLQNEEKKNMTVENAYEERKTVSLISWWWESAVVQPYWKDGIFLKTTTTTTLNISPSNCPFWAFIPEKEKLMSTQNPVQKCS